jgi:flagellar hook-associated protein 3 FlgL
MRVTTLQVRDQRIADIMRDEQRLEETQSQVSTGKRIQRPSDAPDDIGTLLQTRSDVAALTRQRAGADAALPTMQASDAALGNIGTALRQVRTLALQANNSTISPDQRETIAGQIEQVRSQILSLANTEVDGRSIFAGTNSDAAPFTAGPPVSYTGNNTPLQLSLAAGSQFSISVTGQALLNSRGGTDLFQNLSALESAVRSGDAKGTATGLSALDDDLNNVTRQQADIGAREQYVQMLRQQSDANLTATQSRQSQLENVDVAAAILNEKTAENANQAALAMAGRVGQLSLLNYLQ